MRPSVKRDPVKAFSVIVMAVSLSRWTRRARMIQTVVVCVILAGWSCTMFRLLHLLQEQQRQKNNPIHTVHIAPSSPFVRKPSAASEEEDRVSRERKHWHVDSQTRSHSAGGGSVPFPYAVDGAPTNVCTIHGQNSLTQTIQKISRSLRSGPLAKQCSDMVIFSVDFRNRSEQRSTDRPKVPSVRMPSSACRFTFELMSKAEESHDVDVFRIRQSDTQQSSYAILLRRSILPYDRQSYVKSDLNMHRNMLLFKLYGGQTIFSFARRLVWQDMSLQYLPSIDYITHWEESIRKPDVCMSVRKMPLDIVTDGHGTVEVHDIDLPVGPDYTGTARRKDIRFARRCQVLISNAGTQGEADAIKEQCQEYLYRLHADRNNSRSPLSVSLDDVLVDTAFMAWSNVGECKDFSQKLSCDWLLESHFHSKQEDLSFASVAVQSRLQLSTHIEPMRRISTDQILVDERQKKMRIHVGRESCHWSLHEHIAPFQCRSNPRQHHRVPSKRIAIVVAGGLLRFTLNSTLHHFIQPMVRQGHRVDYFLSLQTSVSKAFRSDLEYMNHLTLDPILEGYGGNATQLGGYIQHKIREFGGTPRQVALDRSLDVFEYPPLRQYFELKRYEDIDKRFGWFAYFPMKDVKSVQRAERNAAGNMNILKLFFNIRSLWSDVLHAEREDGRQYDWVFFLRDDTLWLMDIDLNDILTRYADAQLVRLSCDHRIPPMHPLEMNDHIVLVRRQHAAVYGDYIHQLLTQNLTKCHELLPTELAGKNRERGCNSEMLLKWILSQNGVRPVASVGQAVLPLQRSVHVRNAEDAATPCFHKFCNSYDEPLPEHPYGYRLCKDMHF